MKSAEEILKNEEILHLFEHGLDTFAQGDFVGSQRIWKKILERDPGNELAMDYINGTEEEIPFEDKKGSYKELLDEAIRLIGKNEPEPAYELLQMIIIDNPGDEKAKEFFNTTKGILLNNYLNEIGSTRAVPKLKKEMEDIMKINLSKEAAFIVSLIDGSSSIDDLLALSGLETFPFMRNAVMLIRNDIITLK
ncbi:MAG: hypothetical protein M1381_06195 [Deltaproteobacteria bacterium]|nr:hypothetical protein [Deltaproteobacteria bacterium]MCL5791813.1 hypothetical protein [Deltaproteobacteria bacterium]